MLALLVPGVGMGGSGVVTPRGTAGDAGFLYTEITPDTVLLPTDVIYPDGLLGSRGTRLTPGTVGSRGTSSSANAGSGRT